MEDEIGQKTHLSISEDLVGKPLSIASGKRAIVTLDATEKMAADAKGLIHGGFTFGLADYAAMVAVNEPNVVLIASDVKFLRPVKVADRITATAEVRETDRKKRKVWCEVVNQNDERVFEGEFLCSVPERHVLEGHLQTT